MRELLLRAAQALLLLVMAALTVMILGASRTATPEDQFIPPRLDHVQAVGCEVVADKLENAAYVEVYAKHAEEPGWDYRVIIARRDSPEAAFDDCAKWYKDLKSALQKARNKKP